MKNTLSIIADEAFKNERYGCIINGELHVSPSLYNRIFEFDHIDADLLVSLVVIDVDELVYLDNLSDLNLFAGQQVQVFNNGRYFGDGTVTCYPLNMKFDMAEVTMHFPFQGEVVITPVELIKPIVGKNK
jgi:hypothetical protein